jgi:hypothetical protein
MMATRTFSFWYRLVPLVLKKLDSFAGRGTVGCKKPS